MEEACLGCTSVLEEDWVTGALPSQLTPRPKARTTVRKKEEGESHLGISVSFHHTTGKLFGLGSPRLARGKGTEPGLCKDRDVSERPSAWLFSPHTPGVTELRG